MVRRLTLRLDARDRARLAVLVGQCPPLRSHAVALMALRIGLDAIETRVRAQAATNPEPTK